MPRNIAVIALLLTLLTGLAIGRLYAIEGERAPIAMSSDRTGFDIAGRFYTAMNAVLAGGPPDNLERLIASDYQDHSLRAGAGGSVDDLVGYLKSIASTFPEARFEVENIASAGGSVALDVSLTGNGTGSFAGIPVTIGPATTSIEIVRIAHDKVAERWASRDLLPLYETVLKTDGPRASAQILEPRIERYSLDRQRSLELDNRNGSAVIVESGELSLSSKTGQTSDSTPLAATLIRPDRQTAIGSETIRIKPGEIVWIPAGRSFRVWSTDSNPGRFLLLTVRQFATMALYQSSTTQEQAGDLVALAQLRPDRGALQISIGRAMLPPGAAIPPHTVAESELLVVIKGSIEVAPVKGSILVADPSSGLIRTSDEPQLTATGEGASANHGTELSYRATGPEAAEIILVTFTR